MKIWDKGYSINQLVESFTIGRDQEMDRYLAPFDVLGSLAHCAMLHKIGLLTSSEYQQIQRGLIEIYHKIENDEFIIDPGMEDVHSQVEWLLTQQLGDTGKKIHSGRSRNDQVLVDIKLYLRWEIEQLVETIQHLFNLLIKQSENYKDVLIPGYTHLQAAMPSSFGLWFGAYAESLSDDLIILKAAYDIVNQNPLGSAAGYGSSFPIDRTYTTQLLGFESLNYNVVYAQMGRGKSERIVAQAIGSVAATLNKLAADVCLFNNQNFGFIKLPDEFTTGSSIMPHKKNPDIFELTRSKTNKIISLSTEISLITTNLPSGYFRDLQLLKESLFPSFNDLKACLTILSESLSLISVNKDILDDQKYIYLYSVEEVNKLVLQGVPFRDAYKTVAAQIDSGNFHPDCKINHTHEGSIGNLCNDKIAERFEKNKLAFNFSRVNDAINRLIEK